MLLAVAASVVYHRGRRHWGRAVLLRPDRSEPVKITLHETQWGKSHVLTKVLREPLSSYH